MAGAAGGADLADDGEDDVLGGDALGQRAVDADAHVLGFALDQRLRGEHVLDLGGADAVRQRAEGAVRRGVAVAADDGRAGQREALLGADDVDDALPLVELVEVLDAEVARVGGERLDLDAAVVVVDALGAVGGRHVVVDDGERLLRRAHLAARHAQAFERLRARHLVHEMAVDVEEARAVVLALDHVIVEDLVVECLGHAVSRLRWAANGSRRRAEIHPSRLGPVPGCEGGYGCFLAADAQETVPVR